VICVEGKWACTMRTVLATRKPVWAHAGFMRWRYAMDMHAPSAPAHATATLRRSAARESLSTRRAPHDTAFSSPLPANSHMRFMFGGVIPSVTLSRGDEFGVEYGDGAGEGLLSLVTNLVLCVKPPWTQSPSL